MAHYFHEDEYQARDYDSRLMKRLLVYVRPYRFKLAVSVMLLLVVAGLELLGPYLIKRAIDVHIAQKDIPGLLHLVIFFFFVLIAALIAHFAQLYNTRWVGQKVVYDLRMEVFKHLQKLPVAYFDRNPVGRLMTRVTSDVQVLEEMFSAGIVSIFGDIFTLMGIVTAMLILNWKLALVTFAIIPLIFCATFIFRKYVRRAFREVRLKVARINSFMNEYIAGMLVTQLFNLYQRNSGKFNELNYSYYESQIRTILYFAIFLPTVELFSSLAAGLILGYGGKLILAGAMTLGSLIAFLQYSERFFRPIRDLAEKYNILQGAMASSERIFALLDTEPAVASPEKPVKNAPASGNIEFRNVTFAYNEGGPVLKDVSFKVGTGETVAVVGHTGAGKTTIINLLCRFYDVDEGEILVDGVNVKDYELHELRRKIGLVQQDLFLFSGTIEDNICIDRVRSDCETAHEAAKTVQVDKFIDKMPEGYKTGVGERGVTLSIGQRQLLSFARALAVNPEILVLDEATSSVDSETEALIQQALSVLLQGRTSLVIAHRLSTIRKADRIIVLHHGKIRESGNHEQLLAEKGIYYRLYMLQTGKYNNAESVSAR